MSEDDGLNPLALLNPKESTLAVAATIPVVLGIGLELEDDVMNAAAARAIQIVLDARGGDEEAERFVLDCMLKLHTEVRRVLTASAAVTSRPH